MAEPDPSGTSTGTPTSTSTGDPAGAAEPASCDSCGRADADLQAVHRVYLFFDRLGAVTGEQQVPDVERWCLSCRTSYPWQPA